jgi:hypothetical protein
MNFAPAAPAKPVKRRRPLLMGCLFIICLIVVGVGIAGIFVWRQTAYTPPPRQAPAIPERAAGTLTEFPVDNDASAPAQPMTVETETLSKSTSKSASSTQTKLPPGIDRAGLAKGATSMTSTTYRRRPKGASPAAASGGDIYIYVLKAMPDQPTFGESLAAAISRATNGQRTGVRVQSPKGPVYAGSRIRTPQVTVYVLTRDAGDSVILLYSPDPSTQDVVDRLAQNVGNGEGLNDYPEVKDALWTLPSSTPSALTLEELKTFSGDQIENALASSSGSGDSQRILSQMRPFIPARLTGARYTDRGQQEWIALEFEYGSTFQAWRTWLLARSALGLSGSQSTTVREVAGVYLNQDGKGLLVFQKGPYLVLIQGPAGAGADRLVALGNQFQL